MDEETENYYFDGISTFLAQTSDLNTERLEIEEMALLLEEKAASFKASEIELRDNIKVDLERRLAARFKSEQYSLQDKISSLEDELRRKTEALENEKKRSLAEISALRSENESLKAEEKRLVERKEEELNELRAQAEKSSAEIKEKIESLERLEREKYELEENLKKSQAALSLVENEKLKLQEKVQTLFLKEDDLIAPKIANLEKELAALSADNDSLKQELLEAKKTPPENAGLRISMARPLEEDSENTSFPSLSEVSQPLSPVPLSLDASLEPEWMKALTAIRNPLSSAYSRIKQLATLKLPEGPRAVLGLAMGYLSQGLDVLKMIEEFLGETSPVALSGRIDAVLESSLAVWDAAFRRKRILISRRVPAQIPPVLFNPLSLRTVIYQILRNAYEAMPKGGNLKISVGEDLERNQLKLSFADNGPGFSTEALSQLFVPFISLRPGHLGLGLSLARRIVRRYGGELEISTGDTKGAIVEIYLPKAGEPGIPSLENAEKNP